MFRGAVAVLLALPFGIITGASKAQAATTVVAYNSLIPGPGDPYVQDQTYGGAGVTEFGNEINLTTGGPLSDVVVAMHNWGSAISSLPITLTLYNPPGSPPTPSTPVPAGSEIGSVTGDFNFPAANLDGSPSYSMIDFGPYLSTANIVVPRTVVFGISYAGIEVVDGQTVDGPGGSLNVALSTSTSGTSAESVPTSSNISVGSDTYPGYVFVSLLNSVWVGGWQTDAGACSTPPTTNNSGTFAGTYVWCGPGSNPLNGPPYAYEGAGNPDIPAVQFTVVQTYGNANCSNETLPPGPYQNVNVGPNCIINGGDIIGGNVTVQAGGGLWDQGASIHGNLQANNAAWLAIYSPGTKDTVTIGGNLQVTGLTGEPPGGINGPGPATRDPNPYNYVCNVVVHGDVQVQNNLAASGIDIGGQDCGYPLVVDGNLQVHNNAGPVEVGKSVFDGGNTVMGGIQVQNNTGGTTMTDNTGKSCQASGNTPPFAGSGNMPSNQGCPA